MDVSGFDFYSTILVEVFTNHILAENTSFTNRMELTEHKIMVFMKQVPD